MCSGHCAGINNTCDLDTGVCNAGCDPGYQGDACTDEGCKSGYFGPFCDIASDTESLSPILANPDQSITSRWSSVYLLYFIAPVVAVVLMAGALLLNPSKKPKVLSFTDWPMLCWFRILTRMRIRASPAFETLAFVSLSNVPSLEMVLTRYLKPAIVYNSVSSAEIERDAQRLWQNFCFIKTDGEAKKLWEFSKLVDDEPPQQEDFGDYSREDCEDESVYTTPAWTPAWSADLTTPSSNVGSIPSLKQTDPDGLEGVKNRLEYEESIQSLRSSSITSEDESETSSEESSEVD
ncbi:hypothetical protein ElyMa_004149500 [Elysia marginata]|uniref:EGF-like domain-containing protein n=1 Tax=Elysia marginata TaxID=1093978 RepID=A0AAV4GFC6_9GAST|nr:hypothetical protein ElyMa_004149500 [Elysia marginata]